MTGTIRKDGDPEMMRHIGLGEHDKVVLGLSGGVDSTAAALLLKQQGYRVVCLYFDVLGRGKESAEKARKAARALDLPFLYKDMSQIFEREVLSYFEREYLAGRTPNPCVQCNPTVKYRALLEGARDLSAGHIATGHYARVEKRKKKGLYQIRMSANQKKDQSYVLWKLGQQELSRVLFPLGEIRDKEEIRGLLRREGFENAEDKDSQEICFVEKGNYGDFLRQNRGYLPKPGFFTDKEGNVLGSHKGIVFYTVGQRKGLGIALGKPAFVTGIDSEKNRVILGDNQDLFSDTIRAGSWHFPAGVPDENTPLQGRIRYSAPLSACRLQKEKEQSFMVKFDQPQRAPAPGQSLVLYDGEYLAGGGIIEKNCHA